MRLDVELVDEASGDGEHEERQQQASQKLKDAARETGRVDKDQRKQATQKKMSSQMDDLREAMRRAEAQRDEALRAGDQPFGAVVLRGELIVGAAPSRVVTATDPTAIPGPDDPRTAFAHATITARAVIDGIRPDQLSLPTPCPEHDVRSLLGHMLTVFNRLTALGNGTDPMDMPGRWPEIRAELEDRVVSEGPEVLHRQLSALDALAASRMEPSNARRVVRALEVTLGSGRPFSSFGPGLDQYPPVPYVQVGLQWDRPVLAERIAERWQIQ